MPEPDASAARTPERRLDAAALRHTLDRLARAPAAPWLHGEVARRMAERLQVIRLQPQRLLDWSGFLGAGREPLEAAYPKAHRTIVEPNGAFERRSREIERAPWWSPRRLTNAPTDVTTDGQALPAGAAQLIWSNMALHAVKSPPALLTQWQQALSADGFVMFSCLGPGSLVELRDLYRREGWPAPMLDFVDMHDLGDMLVQAGFADPVMDQETLRLHWPGPRELLAELRALGGNLDTDRFGGLRTPRWHARLLAALEGLRDGAGRLALSFEIVYGHAFKGLPRAQAGAPTTVSLEDMRALLHASRASR